jgi:hypothetical protein
VSKIKLKKGEKEQVISFSELFKSLPVNLQKGMKAKMKGMDPQEQVNAVLRAVKSGKFEGYRPVPKSRPDAEQRRRAEAKPKTISLMAKGGKATSKKMMRGGKVAAKKKMAYGGKAMAKKKK